MRVKNTQMEKQVKNIFFDVLAIFLSIICNIFRSIVFFVSGKKNKKAQNSILFRLIDYIVKSWPKDFFASPRGYKIGRFLGDMIHHMFLKK